MIYDHCILYILYSIYQLIPNFLHLLLYSVFYVLDITVFVSLKLVFPLSKLEFNLCDIKTLHNSFLFLEFINSF
jgi:hypothetical protein